MKLDSKKNIFFFWPLIFVVSSFYSYSEICCMFFSARYFGWPFSYLSLHTTTDIYEEAMSVKTDSIYSLMKSGWQWTFSTSMLSWVGFSIYGLLIDLLVSLVLACVLCYILMWLGEFLRGK